MIKCSNYQSYKTTGLYIFIDHTPWSPLLSNVRYVMVTRDNAAHQKVKMHPVTTIMEYFITKKGGKF